jgi:hypothetical protein
MGAVEELSGFKNHLYDMLVAMMSRCDARIKVEEEDVHGEDTESITSSSPVCFG